MMLLPHVCFLIVVVDAAVVVVVVDVVVRPSLIYAQKETKQP